MKIKGLFLFFILLFFISSCSVLYVPTPVNVPMLTNRGEAQINTNLGFYGFSPQFAYAFSNHFGGYINLSAVGKPKADSSSYQYSIAPALGYFYKHGKFRMEVFSGLEAGSLASSYSIGNNTYRGVYTFRSVFLQPTIGYASNLLDLGFTSDFVLISFDDVHSNNTYSTLLLEPLLTAKIGYRRVRLLIQGGLAIDANKDPDVITFPVIATLGLNINLGKARYVRETSSRYKHQGM